MGADRVSAQTGRSQRSPQRGSLALPAAPVQLQAMALDPEAVLTGDRFLQRLDLRVFELDDGAAFGTDQVIVVLFTGPRFIAGLAVTKVAGFGDATLGEELESAVHRRVTDMRMLLTQAQVELLGGEVLPGPEKFIQDDLPLTGRLQLPGSEVGMKISFAVPG